MKFLNWLIRLPRYNRRLAALNRNGIDVERRPRRRLKSVVALSALIEAMRDAVRALGHVYRSPRFPLLRRRVRRPFGIEWPHIPTGAIVTPNPHGN